MMRVILCYLILCLIGPEVYSQHNNTRNNYTGNWENPNSWDPVWDKPASIIFGINIDIFGTITANNSITFTGNDCTLKIVDTLIINGNLFLGNNISLKIDEGGILIVKGNLIINNESSIENGGYLIVISDFVNISYHYGGSFESKSNPSRVFIGGTVPEIYDSSYPVLDCSDTENIPYTYSGCSYGNAKDLMADPIYNFISLLCGVLKASSNSPVCEGDDLLLSSSFTSTSADIFSFIWKGPGNFTSGEQNPVIPAADITDAGLYILTATSPGCTIQDTTGITIYEKPIAIAGPDQILDDTYETSMNAFPVSSGATGEWSLVTGAGIIAESYSPSTRITGLQAGDNKFLWTVHIGNCRTTDEVVIRVNELFIPSVITPNNDGSNDYFQISRVPDKTILVIFNRWGTIEYSSENYKNEWDGKNSHNHPLEDDTYFYIVRLSNGKIKKGSVLIKR